MRAAHEYPAPFIGLRLPFAADADAFHLGWVLSEPGGEGVLDLHAAPWLFEPCLGALVLDDDQCGWVLDAAALGEVGAGVVVDSVQMEGVVVSAALQDLGEVALYAAGAAVAGGVEEEQFGAAVSLVCGCGLRLRLALTDGGGRRFGRCLRRGRSSPRRGSGSCPRPRARSRAADGRA